LCVASIDSFLFDFHYALFPLPLKKTIMSTGIHFGPTTLEQALTHAYNLQIADGTWARTFGRSSLSDFRADNFCTGSVEGWPIPTVEPGTDLARVIFGNDAGADPAADGASTSSAANNSTFHCGFLEDIKFATPTGEVMILTSKADNGTVTGAVVDFWEGLVEKLGAMYETELTLQWKLYPSAQDVLDALQSGELDAGCGFWSSDGTWTDPATGNEVARGLAFSVHTCPIAIQTEFIWALNDSNITKFQDLIDRIKAGEVTRVCSSTSPGGGTETYCRNTLQLYSKSDNSTCEGVRAAAFAQVMAGNCSAVWAGLPTPEEIEFFQFFPQPTATARVTYLRSTDLQNMKAQHYPGDATGRYFERTTLEQAIIRVFNEKVSDGSYVAAISGLTGIESVSFCVGSYDSWLLPKPMEGSDLKAVLDRGVFRCGYPRDRVVATTDGATLIDTSSSSTGGDDVVTGRIADFWNNDLIPALGALYNTTLRIQWILHDFEVSTFNELHSGEIDAACALFNADGSWVSTELGRVVARPLVFSPMYCPAFLQTANIYTLKNSSWSTFEGLAGGVADGSVMEICVSGKSMNGLLPVFSAGGSRFVS